MRAQQPGELSDELSDRSADRAVGDFEAFYQRNYAAVYAYVVRRIGPDATYDYELAASLNELLSEHDIVDQGNLYQ